jgi:hypothetical protein
MYTAGYFIVSRLPKLPSTPFHRGVAVRHRPLGHQVVDVVRPVLNRRVTAAGAPLDDDLDHGRVQTLGAVHRSGTALDVVDRRAFVDDDQRPLELPHVFGVDAEIGLQREVDLHARRHVDERTARPDGRIQGGELVVVRRNDRREVVADDVGVLADGRIRIGEDHALVRKVFLQRAVDHLALELGLDARQELPFGFGDAQLLERVLDLLRDVIPASALVVGRLQVVEDVLEIQSQVSAPLGHRLGFKDLQRPQAEIAHPGGFAFHLGDLRNDVRVQAPASLEDRFALRPKIVFVNLAHGIPRCQGCHIGCHLSINLPLKEWEKPSMENNRFAHLGADRLFLEHGLVWASASG